MAKVLIVDDEPDICFLLKLQLDKMGFITDIAHTIKKAVEMSIPLDYDLVFLDLNLPDGNGLTLVPKLKEKNPEIKIVVCSAHDSSDERRKVADAGVLGFLSKPFSTRSVLKIVNDL